MVHLRLHLRREIKRFPTCQFGALRNVNVNSPAGIRRSAIKHVRSAPPYLSNLANIFTEAAPRPLPTTEKGAWARKDYHRRLTRNAFSLIVEIDFWR